MSLFDWFANRRKSGPISEDRQEREIADGLWTKCEHCDVLTYTKDLRLNQWVCSECGHHHRIFSDERIRQLIDANTWQPIDTQILPKDPLGFKDRKAYTDRLRDMQAKTQINDAVQTGLGCVDGLPVALGVMDFRFMGGSMGSVVGEKTHPSDRTRHQRGSSCHYCLCLRRCQNAGRTAEPDANG